MFQFSGLAHLSVYYTFSIVGCPIRRSADITIVCIFLQLFAAYHVLHRLSEPRHPPCALNCFKKLKKQNLSTLLVVYDTNIIRYLNTYLTTYPNMYFIVPDVGYRMSKPFHMLIPQTDSLQNHLIGL